MAKKQSTKQKAYFMHFIIKFIALFLVYDKSLIALLPTGMPKRLEHCCYLLGISWIQFVVSITSPILPFDRIEK